MYNYYNGDLLLSNCKYICHQCNLQSIFGGGLASQIADKFPNIEEFCQSYKVTLGDHIYYPTKNYTIINCYTQDQLYRTNYDSLEKCLKEIKEEIIEENVDIPVTIGIPYKYGCGIASGDWRVVELIFIEVFGNDDRIDLQIWKL